MFFSFYEEIMGIQEVVFDACTAFAWHFSDVDVLIKFNDSVNYNPKVISVAFISGLYSVEKALVVMVLGERIADLTIRSSLSHSSSSKYPEST